VRDDVLANEPTPTLDLTVRTAIDHVDSLSGYERLVQAGVFSEVVSKLMKCLEIRHPSSA
jgi:hypothetical protein